MKKTVSVIFAAMMFLSSMSGCAANKASTASEGHSLSNPNADENAQKVYDYLCDSFGT